MFIFEVKKSGIFPGHSSQAGLEYQFSLSNFLLELLSLIALPRLWGMTCKIVQNA